MFDRDIAYFAKLTPCAQAFVSPVASVDFARLDADINRVGAALAAAGLPVEGLAAVQLADPYVHVLVLLALARLGRASASLAPSQGPHMLALLAPAMLISDQAADAPGPAWRLHASAEWVAASLQRPVETLPPLDLQPDGLARVTTSSGTTGTPKKLGLSWQAMIDQSITYAMLMKRGGDGLRTLTLLGLESAALGPVLSTWMLGGTAVFASPSPREIVAALPRLKPGSVLLAPAQLRMLLEALPPGFIPLPGMRISLIGADTPAALMIQTRLRLTPDLWVTYASTEAGIVARGHAAQLHEPGAVGWVLPRAQVQVVDEQDAPLPCGATGRLRLRGTLNADGYLDDEAATARSFKDGWFYPGDLGSLSPEGMLRIEGRTDEVMNFGGEKFLPRSLEDPALACPGVLDAAAFTLADTAGLPAPWLAVVRGEGLDEAALSRALAIPLLPPVHIVWIDQIPRTPTGKIARAQLQAATQRLNAPAKQQAPV